MLTLQSKKIKKVTGQAVVVATTCVDDTHTANMMHRSRTKPPNAANARYPLRGNDKDLLSRVESHCIALKKKKNRERYFKGSGCSLKIFTALNGLTKKEVLEELEHVGIVQ